MARVEARVCFGVGRWHAADVCRHSAATLSDVSQTFSHKFVKFVDGVLHGHGEGLHFILLTNRDIDYLFPDYYYFICQCTLRGTPAIQHPPSKRGRSDAGADTLTIHYNMTRPELRSAERPSAFEIERQTLCSRVLPGDLARSCQAISESLTYRNLQRSF